MLAALKRLKASGVFSLGMLSVKWNIPKVDRSIHFLLSRTTKQNLSYGEGDNSVTLFLYLINITIKLSARWCVEALDNNEEDIWYGVFFHVDSVSFYLGRKGYRGYDMPWQIRCLEPYTEVTLKQANNMKYHDQANLNMVQCHVRTYYIRVAPLCLRWARFISWRIYRAEITFNEEVGPRVNTWKGGTNQVSFQIPYNMQCADALTYYSDNVSK